MSICNQLGRGTLGNDYTMTAKGVMSKEATNLDPPKYDPISVEELSKSDGM